LIAATNRNLPDEVKAGRFREDLFFRINVVQIHIPPLRERREDIMPLVEHFLRVTGTRLNRPMKRLTPAAKDLLVGAEWPGNIRELANVIERAIVLARGDVLDVDDFPQLRGMQSAGATGAMPLNLTLRDLEKQHILNVLAANDYSLQKSADVLGIHRNTLRQKMKEYGIEKPDAD